MIVGKIAAAVVVTLIFLTFVCLMIWGIVGCDDYCDSKPFTKIMEKIVWALLMIDLVVGILIGILLIIALWSNAFV